MAQISKHAGNDWCHICGKRSYENIDIRYPKNAEHDIENTEYIRICSNCIKICADCDDCSIIHTDNK